MKQSYQRMWSYQFCDHDWPKRGQVLGWNPQQENTKHHEHLGRSTSAGVHTQSLCETLWKEEDWSFIIVTELLAIFNVCIKKQNLTQLQKKKEVYYRCHTLDEGQIEMILVEFSTEHGKRLALQQHGFLIYISKQFQGAALHTYITEKYRLNNQKHEADATFPEGIYSLYWFENNFSPFSCLNSAYLFFFNPWKA